MGLRGCSYLLGSYLGQANGSPVCSYCSRRRLGLICRCLYSGSLFYGGSRFDGFFGVFGSRTSSMARGVGIGASEANTGTLLEITIRRLAGRFSTSLIGLFFTSGSNNSLGVTDRRETATCSSCQERVTHVLSWGGFLRLGTLFWVSVCI